MAFMVKSLLERSSQTLEEKETEEEKLFVTEAALLHEVIHYITYRKYSDGSSVCGVHDKTCKFINN